MCGCNKNRGLRSPAPQTNPAYNPNVWNRPQTRTSIPVHPSVQNKAVSKPVNTIPVQNNVVPVVQQSVIPNTTQNNVNNLNIVPTQNKPSVPVQNPINLRQNIPIKSAVRPPVMPVRTPPVQIRAPYVPVRTQVNVPNVPQKPVNVPVKTPYVPVHNKPNGQLQNNPKPVTNTVITRNVNLSIPVHPVIVPKPTNIIQPTPQTLLANRISAANRKR
ncbi:hypothetical protein Klosneuvirus_7_11 [Klosneuvirus KNV1]|uniref:Uncharacterized protein n=1 Tax=Klosneuvirus KNV1 TaxID=1977640 RepID=A0A1V0SLJ2_9VIRU|nr:hypothetical protein Klosneuvirus_7_11 [Klosneuvirus KNV1]